MIRISKKTISTISLVLLIFLIGCSQSIDKTPVDDAATDDGLSNIQIETCDAAHKANTCDTRLVEVGIVTAKECCEVLEKCC